MLAEPVVIADAEVVNVEKELPWLARQFHKVEKSHTANLLMALVEDLRVGCMKGWVGFGPTCILDDVGFRILLWLVAKTFLRFL